MRRFLALAICTACGGADEPPLFARIEHQPRALADVVEQEWVAGNEIVVDDTATFPQPLTVRYSIVDSAGVNVGIGQHMFSTDGTTQLARINGNVSGCRYPLPDEPAQFCTAEFNVQAFGSNLLLLYGDQATDCVYYAIVESTVDVEALRVELEGRATACRDAHDSI